MESKPSSDWVTRTKVLTEKFVLVLLTFHRTHAPSSKQCTGKEHNASGIELKIVS
jgi:hypothetical protein